MGLGESCSRGMERAAARARQNSRPGRAYTSYQNRKLAQEPRKESSHLVWESGDPGAKRRVRVQLLQLGVAEKSPGR